VAHDSDDNDHYLLDILVSGLDAWFKGLVLSPDRYPRRYHRLIAEQTSLGWRHMFNGHLSTEWRSKQDHYVRRRKIKTRTNTGAGWSLRTITLLWTEFFVVWTSRNEAIHGHDQSTQQQARRRKLKAEMELLHTYRNDVLAGDTDVFIGDSTQDLDTYLEVATASQVQNWLYVWRPLILSSLKEAKDVSIRGVNHLTTYFSAQTPTTSRKPTNARSHRKARPRIRASKALPQPAFRFRSLRSFFGTSISATNPV
jgi:hypothetical protein